MKATLLLLLLCCSAFTATIAELNQDEDLDMNDFFKGIGFDNDIFQSQLEIDTSINDLDLTQGSEMEEDNDDIGQDVLDTQNHDEATTEENLAQDSSRNLDQIREVGTKDQETIDAAGQEMDQGANEADVQANEALSKVNFDTHESILADNSRVSQDARAERNRIEDQERKEATRVDKDLDSTRRAQRRESGRLGQEFQDFDKEEKQVEQDQLIRRQAGRTEKTDKRAKRYVRRDDWRKEWRKTKRESDLDAKSVVNQLRRDDEKNRMSRLVRDEREATRIQFNDMSRQRRVQALDNSLRRDQGFGKEEADFAKKVEKKMKVDDQLHQERKKLDRMAKTLTSQIKDDNKVEDTLSTLAKRAEADDEKIQKRQSKEKNQLNASVNKGSSPSKTFDKEERKTRRALRRESDRETLDKDDRTVSKDINKAVSSDNKLIRRTEQSQINTMKTPNADVQKVLDTAAKAVRKGDSEARRKLREEVKNTREQVQKDEADKSVDNNEEQVVDKIDEAGKRNREENSKYEEEESANAQQEAKQAENTAQEEKTIGQRQEKDLSETKKQQGQNVANGIELERSRMKDAMNTAGQMIKGAADKKLLGGIDAKGIMDSVKGDAKGFMDQIKGIAENAKSQLTQLTNQKMTLGGLLAKAE